MWTRWRLESGTRSRGGKTHPYMTFDLGIRGRVSDVCLVWEYKDRRARTSLEGIEF